MTVEAKQQTIATTIKQAKRSQADLIILEGGSNPYEGTVRIYHDYTWCTICDSFFDDTDATVLCRELGYSGGTAYGSAYFGEAVGSKWLVGLECNGNEASLNDCSHSGWYSGCGHERDAGVACDGPPTESGLGIRLVGGAIPSEGRVEIFYANEWGTVCDDFFENVDATVACRELGYSCGIPFSSAYFGEGTGPIWMDETTCWGTETHLRDCGSAGWGVHNCEHSKDVGVACYDSASGVYQSAGAQIRLVGGSSQYEGRVEIFHANQWGTVCDDDFEDIDATVVCRELGYSGGTRYEAAHFGEGTGEIWLDDVACTGDESRLSDCGNPGWV
ncbi:neurotrypsin-like [Ptychodera flava]|uniref:neurotrypsin-like n=1 Tax=Ptychodera flava TaxID=63121 RepID=UPI00396A3988